MKQNSSQETPKLSHAPIINGQIYFGEMTFAHMSGLLAFEPFEWDERFGEWLDISRLG